MLSPRIPELSALEMLAAVHDLGSLSAAGKYLGLSNTTSRFYNFPR